MTGDPRKNTLKRSIWRSKVFLGSPYYILNTPRICFLKAMRKVLEDMPVRIWNLEREMVERVLGGRPDLLPVNEDDEMDNEMGPEDH